MKPSPGPSASSSPRAPLFLLASSGRPLVWDHGGDRAILAYSSGQDAVAAVHLLHSRGMRRIGVLSVSTTERLQEVVSQLTRHGVRSMIWDYRGDSTKRQVIDLKTVVQPE